MTYFDENRKNSIKSTAIEKFKGKMLMFSQMSLTSFVYDLISVFCFPDENVKKMYEKYNIQKFFLYQNLTNTDSTTLFFIFVCNMISHVSEKESRNIIFEE